VEHIVYIFEGFRLDAGRRQLSSSGGVVLPLNSRAMEALVILLSHAGELVTKKQLLEGVWPSAVVEDNNINQCILAIRKALGESAGSNRFVMTVPGRGYRFVAPVVQQSRESPDSAAAEPVAQSLAQTRAPRWRMFALPALGAAAILALLLVAASRDAIVPRQLAQSRELVVHLRSNEDVATTQAALLACLRERPDLHLQVDVHVVGFESAQPLWTGRYIAGAQDLLPEGADLIVGSEACQRLAAH
jgi:DNA-binding winged helix-turn-helix (wHTH) protein